MGIFDSGKSAKAAPGSMTARTVSQPGSSDSGTVESKHMASTIIGPNSKITGEIWSDENILINGQVEGKIRSSKVLIIGKRGNVKAELEADIVSVQGKVSGNCSASSKVEITSTGSIFGNIEAPAIAVAEGAIFRGASKMKGDTTTAKPPLPAQGAHPKVSAPLPKDRQTHDQIK